MKYTEKNLLISRLSVLSNCWGAQIYLVQDHRALFSKLCLCDIIKVLLYTNDLSHQPQNNIQSTSVVWTCCTCHFMKFSLTWSDNSCTSYHVVHMWLWKFCMSGRCCLSLSPSLPLFGRCKWCKFLSCSTPMLFWCDGNPFARPITPSHQH